VIINSSDYLCDIGHTSANCYQNGSSFRISLSKFNPKEFSDRVFYITVNREFQNFPDNWINLDSHIKIDTDYKTLGVDRRVAIFQAKNSIIADFGSAITVDIVKESRHLGGYIMLGRDEVINGFQRKTPHLNFKNIDSLELNKPPMLSEDALYYGFFHSTSIFINSLSDRYRVPITITGGYSKEFLPFLKSVTYRENLLFENMEKIILSI